MITRIFQSVVIAHFPGAVYFPILFGRFTSGRTWKARSSSPHPSTGESYVSKLKRDKVITIDRRERTTDRRAKSAVATVERGKLERRTKVQRRRQIDPTTCERDYTPDEVEFMNAMNTYKRTSGRMFPTCSEVLEVIRALGYAKGPTEASGS
jgi:hypothetical protein